MKFIATLILSFLGGLGGAFAAPSAEEILVACDAIRHPQRPFSVTVTLNEFQVGKQVDTSTLVSYSRAQQQGGQFARTSVYTVKCSALSPSIACTTSPSESLMVNSS